MYRSALPCKFQLQLQEYNLRRDHYKFFSALNPAKQATVTIMAACFNVVISCRAPSLHLSIFEFRAFDYVQFR